MEWKKVAPWNWFKDEEASSAPTRGLAPRRGRRSDPTGDWRTELARLLEDAFGGSDPAWPERSTGPSGLVPLRPQVDISEGRKAYTVRVELPGVERDDVSLTVEGQTLVLRAEKRREEEEEEEGLHWVESSYGAIQRLISLPEDADTEGIQARFKNGVLKLRLPKHPASARSGRNVEIQAG